MDGSPAGNLVMVVALTGEVTPRSFFSMNLAEVYAIGSAPLTILSALLSPVVSVICLALFIGLCWISVVVTVV